MKNNNKNNIATFYVLGNDEGLLVEELEFGYHGLLPKISIKDIWYHQAKIFETLEEAEQFKKDKRMEDLEVYKIKYSVSRV